MRALARSHGLAAAPGGAPKGAPAVTQNSDPASDEDHSGCKAGSRGLGAAGRHGPVVPTLKRRAAAAQKRRADGAGRYLCPVWP